MNNFSKTQPISPAQLQALQATWGRLRAEGDCRAVTDCEGRACVALDDRDARLCWASSHLGRTVESFSDLNTLQAAYLLDILAGRPTKLDVRLGEAFGEAGVRDREAWFARFKADNLKWKYHDRDLSQLDRYQKYILIQTLVTRQPARQATHDYCTERNRRMQAAKEKTLF